MKSILILFFFGVSLSAFSQGDFDQRLLAKYSEEQLAALEQKNPDLVGYMEYYLDYGYTILPKSALNDQKSAGTIALKSLKPGKINIFDSYVSFPLDHDVYYEIEGESDVLVLYAREKSMQMYYKSTKTNVLNK